MKETDEIKAWTPKKEYNLLHLIPIAIESYNSDEINKELFPITEQCNGMNAYCAGFVEGRRDIYSKDDMISFATFYYTHQGKATEFWGQDLFKIWKEKNGKS